MIWNISILNNSGLLQIPMSLLVLLTAMSFAGLSHTLEAWTGVLQSQLELDRCTSVVSKKINEIQNKIERKNRLIQTTRAAILAASTQPQIQTSLKSLLAKLKIAQDIELYSWRMTLLSSSCLRQAVPLRFPRVKWKRPPADLIGPQALIWKGTKSLSFLLKKKTLYSAAEVFFDEKKQKWHRRWSTRPPFRGTGAL